MKTTLKLIIWGAIIIFIYPASGAEERYTDLQNFAKVLNLIEQHYVDPVDSSKLIQGAVKGMLRELDPHSSSLTADQMKDFEAETSGEFGGLGIELSVKENGQFVIISPIEDTPAYKAGIEPGDRIMAVDGKPTKGLSLAEISLLLRGRRGKKVTLNIARDNEKTKDYVIERGSVKIKSVKPIDLDGGFLYAKITSFIDNTAPDMEKALTEATKDKKNIRGLLIDLRRNPGGLLDQAIKLSDLFIHEGTIVSTIGRDPKSKEEAKASGHAKYTDFPMVILIDGGSASASEIFAGAMKDNKRALIVGERSFGKGSVQSVVKLPNGSGLKLTVARYYTPSGKSIQAEGIVPDLEIESVDNAEVSEKLVAKETLREKDIQGHLENKDDEKEAETVKKSISLISLDKVKADEKKFKNDAQAIQAFRYLKAMKYLKELH